MLESYEQQELVAFVTAWRGLVDDFADQLAGAADKDDLGAVLGEWLLDRDEVDDVFADDQALEQVVIEQARRLAAETPAAGSSAPDSADSDDDDSADDDDDDDDDFAAYDLEGYDPDADEREAWIAQQSRRPFIPKTREGDGPATASKFGGVALLLPGEAWPVCPGCAKPMRMFVQLDLSGLPADFPHPHREGMVQLFYCTTVDPLCEVDHEAWQPFGKSSRARWLSAGEVAQASQAHSAEARGPTGEPAAVLEGWEPATPELPGYEEDVPPPPDSLEDPQDDAPAAASAATRPRPGDKLGGWPSWVQGPEYPACPKCKTRMVYLLQLESNGLCRHQFGDLGAGHLSQCPDHPEVVAFGWACH